MSGSADKYVEVTSEGVRHIRQMERDEAEHRRQLERDELTLADADRRQHWFTERLRSGCGRAVAVATLAVGAYGISLGAAWPACGLVGAVIVALVWNFIGRAPAPPPKPAAKAKKSK